ncbi:MAG: SARP family transcriptional regulator, partial [Hamadaea sp.]|nr:SARP family transcriptional regulator [Hamadaea sp.]
GPGAADTIRARLLATVALESRGAGGTRPAEAAREAVRLARGLGDPTVLAFALNAAFMQTFHRCGLAAERDAIGAQVIAVAVRHGLPNYEILGHLVRLQAHSALGDLTAAQKHAAQADHLATVHERPLVGVFTTWFAAMRSAATGAPTAEDGYRRAAAALAGAGMPGVEHGLLPLAILCLRVWRGLPLDFDDATDWGPYAPWARPLVLAARDRTDEAVAALRQVPDPPPDLLMEALWCLVADAAVRLDEPSARRRARTALTPAAGEQAAGSGMLTAGPVAHYLARLDSA